MRTYRHRHVVTLDETNLVGNVYFAHYLHWQGHCREHFLAEHCPGILTLLDSRKFALVTLSCEMNYYAECFAFDEIDIAMGLDAASGSQIVMSFEFLRGEQRIARGAQVVACMNRTSTGVEPIEIPADLARALVPFAA